MLNNILILLGKAVSLISKSFNLGSGSTWPGHIALELNSSFIRNIFEKNKELKVVIVAGTNGKTTTSTLLKHIFEYSRLRVFQNSAGANLLNGIASSIIENSSLTGRLNFDVAIFEVDENNVLLVAQEIEPFAIVLLNIFRDQLDRYGEVNKVVQDWREALSRLNLKKHVEAATKTQSTTLLFTNGDDPALSYLAKNSVLKTFFFGLDEKLMKKEKTEHDVDFIYCPNCQTKLTYGKISFSHMGKFKCPKCGFINPETETFPTLPHPLLGNYNIYNFNAAALVANKAFDVPLVEIRKALKNFKPAFGRQEVIKYKGRDVLILLSKNPAGFNQSIEAVSRLILKTGSNQESTLKNKRANILLVLNDRIPDGRDVSWIWDVNTEELFRFAKNIFISGDRCYDMALRIKYSRPSEFPISNFQFPILDNLKDAIEKAISETPTGKMLFVLPTYSAMLETRKILLGRKLL